MPPPEPTLAGVRETAVDTASAPPIASPRSASLKPVRVRLVLTKVVPLATSCRRRRCHPSRVEALASEVSTRQCSRLIALRTRIR
jgi:hypothetical protein